MGRAWAVAGMVCLLAGSADAQIQPGPAKLIKLSSKQIAVVKNEISTSVRGDSELIFEKPFYAVMLNEVTIKVCSYVTAKNDSGGDTKIAPFSGLLNKNKDLFIILRFGVSDKEKAVVIESCAKSGIQLK